MEMTMTPIETLCRQVATASEKVALTKNKEVWTYGRLVIEVDGLVRGFVDRGLRKGDRIALHTANLPQLIIAYHACFRIGTIAAPFQNGRTGATL